MEESLPQSDRNLALEHMEWLLCNEKNIHNKDGRELFIYLKMNLKTNKRLMTQFKRTVVTYITENFNDPRRNYDEQFFQYAAMIVLAFPQLGTKDDWYRIERDGARKGFLRETMKVLRRNKRTNRFGDNEKSDQPVLVRPDFTATWLSMEFGMKENGDNPEENLNTSFEMDLRRWNEDQNKRRRIRDLLVHSRAKDKFTPYLETSPYFQRHAGALIAIEFQELHPDHNQSAVEEKLREWIRKVQKFFIPGIDFDHPDEVLRFLSVIISRGRKSRVSGAETLKGFIEFEENVDDSPQVITSTPYILVKKAGQICFVMGHKIQFEIGTSMEHGLMRFVELHDLCRQTFSAKQFIPLDFIWSLIYCRRDPSTRIRELLKTFD